jgi:ABC-2 type transport system ATP-binding protein
MLIVDNIHKSYKKEPVLRGITFAVPPSSILGLYGGNGTGKTTLIHIIASILPADRGTISLMGIPIVKAREYRSRIGFVPQEIALSPNLTVRQNLSFWASMHGLAGTSLKDAVEYAAEAGNVNPFINKLVSRCSGGMVRRVNLAVGLIGCPDLLLLDEPTAGIDEENRSLIFRTIFELRAKGRIIVMADHYYGELSKICDRIVTLQDGVITEGAAHV